jgi:hypothetical protein
MIVCEYVGEVMTWRRILEEEQKNDSIFQLISGKNADKTLYICPQKYTNIARFINGASNKGKKGSNVKSLTYLINEKTVVILATIRPIKKGESLKYDYNGGYLKAYPTEDFE